MSENVYEEINGLIQDLQSNVSTKMVDMIITNRRILIIRTKSALIEPMKGRGIVGVTYEILAEKRKKEVPQKSLEEALAEDPKNRSIPLEAIDHVKLKKGWLSTDILIFPREGKKMHFAINSKIYYDEWKQVLESSIPGKLVI